jgi:hypothetical protein
MVTGLNWAQGVAAERDFTIRMAQVSQMADDLARFRHRFFNALRILRFNTTGSIGEHRSRVGVGDRPGETGIPHPVFADGQVTYVIMPGGSRELSDSLRNAEQLGTVIGSAGVLGVAGALVAPELALMFAVRYPTAAAILGLGASTGVLDRARNAGATGSANLAGVVGQSVANTVNAVLRGRIPLDSLARVDRQVAAQFFRGVAERAGGRFAAEAARFNIERARFLEGATSRIPGGLSDFMKR